MSRTDDLPERPAPLSGRAGAMAERLAQAARRAGIEPAGVALLEEAFARAMRPRQERLADAQHPDFLHPGRTTLILLEDLGVGHPAVLAAGALAETLHPELAAAPPPGDDAATREIRDLLAQVPAPAHARDRLLEDLLAADPSAQLIALAERLDHARHLHLRPAAAWEGLHHETCAVYLPLAERTHPTLARRFRWWCRTFERRFLQGGPTTPA